MHGKSNPEMGIINLFKEGRYQDALDLLRKQIQQDPNNHILYYLKGVAEVYMEKTDDALMDLGEAMYLNPRHIPSMHAFAYIFLKRGDYQGAVNKWLSILELNPKDPIAKKHLKQFKKEFPEPGKLNLNPDLYMALPKPKKEKKKRPWIKKLLIFILVIAALLGGFWIYLAFQNKPFQWIPSASEIFPARIYYSFTEKEIGFFKKEIFELVNRQKYNQAKFMMNKIYLSNASLEDKKLLKTWEARLEYPEMDTLGTDFTPESVFERPQLYEDCFVVWEGKVTSLLQKDRYLVFELELENGKTVSALFLSNYPLQEKTRIKLLGKVILKNKKEIELEVFNLEKLDS
jgi:tetratricopeptide (TPR) repeat protein